MQPLAGANLLPLYEQKNIRNLAAVGIASTDLSRHSPEGFTARMHALPPITSGFYSAASS
jgi:hypothetical protein